MHAVVYHKNNTSRTWIVVDSYNTNGGNRFTSTLHYPKQDVFKKKYAYKIQFEKSISTVVRLDKMDI